MGHDTSVSRLWVTALVIAAVAVSGYSLLTDPVAFVAPVLTVGLIVRAALMRRFPRLRLGVEDEAYRPALAVAVAVAVVFPPFAIAPLVALCALSALWRERREVHDLARWLAAVAPLVLSAHVVSAFAPWGMTGTIHSVLDLLALVGAGLLFLAVQYTLSGITVALGGRVPFGRVSALRSTATVADGLSALIGVVAAGIWLTSPLMVGLLLPALLIAHHLVHHASVMGSGDVDAKTGLYTSRYFERAATAELAAGVRHDTPATVLFADLDHFKQVNDRHGHLAGDTVLRDVTTLLTATLRGGDIVARFGGEEFVAFLPDVDEREAVTLAERVRATIEAHSFVLASGETVRCTVSVGTASTPNDGTNLSTLIGQADRAMYRAKQTRNATQQAHTLPGAASLAERAIPVIPPACPPRARDWRVWLVPIVLWATVTGGGLAACLSLIAVQRAGTWSALPLLIALAVLTGLLPVRLYETHGEKRSFNLGFAVGMATIVLIPLAAPLVGLTNMIALNIRRQQRRPDKFLFNISNVTLAAGCAALLHWAFRAGDMISTPLNIVAIISSAVIYYFINTGLVSTMVALHSGQSLWALLRQSVWTLPLELTLGLTGAFVATIYTDRGIGEAIIFAVLLLLLYGTLSIAARKNEQAVATLAAAKVQVEQANVELIETLSSVIDARDAQVSGHSRNVARYAVAIATEMKRSAADIQHINTAALLHDLGKVAIPEVILHKPERLTAEEFTVMREHADIGRSILAGAPLFIPIAEMVGDHHERWDGGGYPAGKRGEQVSIGGRILAVADALDSMISDRVYSRGKPLAWALQELSQCAGQQFDPAVVAVLLRIAEARRPEFFRDVAPAQSFPNNIVTIPLPQAAVTDAMQTFNPTGIAN